jgi:hypothetical protein
LALRWRHQQHQSVRLCDRGVNGDQTGDRALPRLASAAHQHARGGALQQTLLPTIKLLARDIPREAILIVEWTTR